MKKSTISDLTYKVDPKEKPYGFMYVCEIQNGRYPSFTGCVELKDGEDNTSFFFRVHDLNLNDKEYECAFFKDNSYKSPFMQCVVSFVDKHSMTVSAEFFSFDEDWVHVKEDFVRFFHCLVFVGMVDIIKPREANGKLAEKWFVFLNQARKNRISENVNISMSDMISTINLLLP